MKCVGYDPITKREIPRSYVHYLETRSAYLESLLTANNIPFSPAESFPDLAPPPPPTVITTPTTATSTAAPEFPPPLCPQQPQPPIDPALTNIEVPQIAVPEPKLKRERSPQNPDSLEEKKLDNLVSDIGLVSFAGASDPRYLGSVSGISFARVVFAAVKSSATGNSNNDQNSTAADGVAGARRNRPRIGSSTRIRGARGLGIGASGASGKEEDLDADDDEDTQMRDSFFGLHTKPTITPAPFPTRALAQRLVNRYFEYANPQIPILHIGEFDGVLDRIYGTGDKKLNNSSNEGAYGGSPKEKYMVNIVCAIGAGIFLKGPDELSDAEESEDEMKDEGGYGSPKVKTETGNRRKGQTHYEPEQYHAAAVLHLETFLSQSKGGLEELQAVLLLAGYALLRPVSPGLWYIVGVALRLAVDLGLHYEDSDAKEVKKDGKEGRREWSRELRRRLWWCVYSLDRLVSTCVGRPFGIADEVISTKFPSILGDQYIHPNKGITPPSPGKELPSYKLIAHHYFRLRLLQSEILQVLQQQSHSFSFTSSNATANPCVNPPLPTSPLRQNEDYPAHHPYHLQTPYLRGFKTVQCWHKDIDRRLKEWMDSSPKTKDETGVSFSLEFLELNYWQTKIMLYRPCLSVPVLLAGELGGSGSSARGRAAERGLGGKKDRVERAEEEERVYLVVAEAGSKVLRLYRHLHRVHQVNYTFLATHHLFMAGISFLYAIWHSPLVRSRLSMDEVDFTILAATSVLGDLVNKCPPAEACRDAFERMSRATVQMCLAGKRGPINKIMPSGTLTHHTGVSGATGMTAGMQTKIQGMTPFQHEDGEGEDMEEIEEQGEDIKFPDTGSMVFKNEYSSEFSQMHHQHPHQRHNRNGYSTAQQQQSLAQQRRREVIHFDDGFRDLFTTASAGTRYSNNSRNANNNAHPHAQQHQQPSPQQQYGLSPTNQAESIQQTAFHPPLSYSSAEQISPHLPHSPHPHPQQHQNIWNKHQNHVTHSSAGSSPPILAGPGLPCSGLVSQGEEIMIDPQLQYPMDGMPWGNLDMGTFGLGALDWEGDSWSDSGSAAGGIGGSSGNPGGMDLFDGFFFGGGGAGH